MWWYSINKISLIKSRQNNFVQLVSRMADGYADGGDEGGGGRKKLLKDKI